MSEKVVIWCEQHEEAVGPHNYDAHRFCLLSRWEYGWHSPAVSPAPPKVPGNLAPEGGHVKHPIRFLPPQSGLAYQMRSAALDDGTYVHVGDLLTYLGLVATGDPCDHVDEVILAFDAAQKESG